jgi:hypothetical protein
VSGQRHAPAAFYPREGIPSTHWTGGRLAGPQSWSGRRDSRNNSLPLPGIESRSYSLESDTILTELPQLLRIKDGKINSEHK